MYCKFCGKEIDENNKFCPYCGQNLEQNDHTVADPAGGRKKNHKAIIIMSVVLAAAVVLIIVIVVIAAGRKKETDYTQKMAMGDKYLSALDYDEAELCYQESIRIDKNQLRSYLQLAVVYTNQSMYERAEDILKQAEQQFSDDPKALEKIRKQKEETERQKMMAAAVPSPKPADEPVVLGSAATPVPKTTAAPPAETNAGEPQEMGFNNMTDAYKSLLQDVHKFPRKYVTLNDPNDIEGCDFSIYDLNQDGMDDLIMTFTNTSTAAQLTDVWTYDASQKLVKPLGSFGVSWQYYSNGTIKDNAAHNHTSGSAIWPYTLLKYNASSGQFEKFASAYCVDKDWGSSSGDYQEELDSDGDGVLYYFELNGTDHGPLTKEEYLSYADQFIPSEASVSLKWTAITNENIANIQ